MNSMGKNTDSKIDSYNDAQEDAKEYLLKMYLIKGERYKNVNSIRISRLELKGKLLDRYEKSAEIVQQKNQSIIGKHIGANCSPSVSNASITDALNKHAKKMYELFSRYPDKWPIIRTEFRSVANIIEKESVRRQSIA